MTGGPSRRILNVEDRANANDAEQLELTRWLRSELLALSEVERMGWPAASAAPRNRAAGSDWRRLIHALKDSRTVLMLIAAIQAWLTLHTARASLTSEMGRQLVINKGASSDTAGRLMEG